MATPIRKVLFPKIGDVSTIEVIDSTIGAPKSGEVQVKILYSGFAGADVNMRLGVYPLQKRHPLTPGYCFVGRVHANGPRSDKFAPGDLVAAMTVYDSQSTLLNVPQKYLYRVPDGMDHAVATSMILDWNTAYGCVIQTAKVTAGQRVFVHGASGACGNAIAQLCLLRGAEVYGTASQRNHQLLRDQGVKPFVYTDRNWVAAMKELGGVHAVFDPIGFDSWDDSYSILTSAESSVLVALSANKMSFSGDTSNSSIVGPLAKLLGQNLKFYSKKRTVLYYITRDQSTFGPHLMALFELVQSGKIKPVIKNSWPMEDVKKAHETWQKPGVGVGSYVIQVSTE